LINKAVKTNNFIQTSAIRANFLNAPDFELADSLSALQVPGKNKVFLGKPWAKSRRADFGYIILPVKPS
jgi:hypothetical protein